MNPLFNQSRPPASQQNPNVNSLLDFIRTTSPQQAKAQVEQIVRDRGISATEFDAYKQKAQQIAKTLGLV